MKITFLLPPVNMSGGIRVVAIYAEELVRRGHTVTLVSVPQRATRTLHRIQQVLRLRRPLKSHLDGLGLDHRILESARDIVDSDVPDADVVVATWWETAEWAAGLSPSKGAKVYFVQGHEVYLSRGAERCMASYRLPFKKIAVSRWLSDIMSREYDDHDVDIVHNSVDHRQFHAPPRAKQIRPTVGLLYSNVQVKGVDVAVKAVELLRQRIPDLRVVSFGSAQPDPQFQKIVEFSFDPPQNTLRDIYASCDVWLAASRSEGFNLTAMEAMACRTPVVSTRTGWPEEVLVKGVNGALVDIDDSEALASQACEILMLPDAQWQKMSEAAFAAVCDSSWERAAGQFEAALMRAASRDNRQTQPVRSARG